MTDDTRALREPTTPTGKSLMKLWLTRSDYDTLDAEVRLAICAVEMESAALAAARREPVGEAAPWNIDADGIQRSPEWWQGYEAAIRGSAGLDADVLAEAMVLAFRAEAKENWPFLNGDGWPAYDETGHPTQVMRYKVIGARVAAEYARLARTTEEPT